MGQITRLEGETLITSRQGSDFDGGASLAMRCFKLPLGLCRDIEMLTRKFWWGQRGKRRKIHWKNWETLCKPKSEGDLGFKELENSMRPYWQNRYGDLFMIKTLHFIVFLRQSTFQIALSLMQNNLRALELGRAHFEGKASNLFACNMEGRGMERKLVFSKIGGYQNL